MIAPPLTTERLLEALSPKTELRDDIIGDLAQEFARRLERGSVLAARLWYYREAVRVAPHLLRAWGRTVRGVDVAHLSSLVFASYIFSMMINLAISYTVYVMARLLGATSNWQSTVWMSYHVAFRIAIVFLIVAIASALAGAIAAWLGDRTPLVAAFTTGMLWACLLVAVALTPRGDPLVFLLLGMAIEIICCATLGGVLQVHATRFRTDSAASVVAQPPTTV